MRIRQTVAQSGTATFVGGIVLFGIIVIVIAIFLGRSDSGQINVNDTIQEANEVNAESGVVPQVETVNDALRNMPNGGLVPQSDSGSESQPEAVPAEEGGASGEDAATSTEPSEVTGGEASESPSAETAGTVSN